MKRAVSATTKGFFGALIKAFGYLGLMVSGGVLAVIILMIFKVDNTQIIAMLSSTLSVAAICLYLKGKNRNLKESLFIKRIGFLSTVRLAMLTLAVTVAVQALQLAIPQSIAKTPYNALSGNLFLDVLCLVFFSPVSEELYFRALWLPTLSEGMSKTLAVIISSLVFSAIHGNPVQIILAFFISIFYSIVFLRSKSVFACILAHCVSNLAAVIFNLFGGGNGLF